LTELVLLGILPAIVAAAAIAPMPSIRNSSSKGIQRIVKGRLAHGEP
jgi:hypothetical protein